MYVVVDPVHQLRTVGSAIGSDEPLVLEAAGDMANLRIGRQPGPTGSSRTD